MVIALYVSRWLMFLAGTHKDEIILLNDMAVVAF